MTVSSQRFQSPTTPGRFIFPGKDEPNDLPGQATPLYFNEPSTTAHYGYLRPNDMDFFEVLDVNGPEIFLDVVEPGKLNVSWNAVAGAEKYYVWLNDILQTPDGQTAINIQNLSVGAGFDIMVRSFANNVYGPATRRLIFYDKGSYSDGWRYLEAWTADESGIYQWKTSSTATTGTLTAIGTGYTNTYSAMAGAAHPAAQAARDATHGSKTDWFLPSKDELLQMYMQLSVIGGLGTGPYWSSSEFNSSEACYQHHDPIFQGSVNKDYNAKIRVVRAF